ncbi:MAG: PLP-dependent aminotransferase family protein [Chloroflexi bacterium]|nr:MAG: PLP-dependent aminotransferase family protein [Chloroflexota bacterium]
MTFSNQPPDKAFIDLGMGWPGFDLLPQAILKQAANHRLGEDDRSLLNYGDNPGDGRFRTALADFLTRSYRESVTPEALFLTAGASQALGLICHLFTQPGDTLLVEDRTYFLAMGIFEGYGLKLVSVPTDGKGLIVEALVEKVVEHKPVGLYTIPTFQNPTGVTLSQSRRERLVELSQAHNFLIIADEVYHLLNYTTTPPPTLASYAESGTVLSVGSFAKILAPGLRLGWIQTSPRFVERLAADAVVASGGALNHFTAGLVTAVLEQRWQDQYLTSLKDTFRLRAAVLSNALRLHFPELTFHEPQGGYFVWLELPEHVDTEELLRVSRPFQVGFQPGVKFSPDQAARSGLRLGFSFYEPPELELGVARLRQAFSAYLKQK